MIWMIEWVLYQILDMILMISCMPKAPLTYGSRRLKSKDSLHQHCMRENLDCVPLINLQGFTIPQSPKAPNPSSYPFKTLNGR